MCQVKEIEVHNTSNCYSGIPASFVVNKERINGFLTSDNILTRTSDLINCDDTRDRSYFLKNSQILIRQIGSKILVENKKNVIKKTINLNSVNMTGMNFAHSQLILDGIDIIKTLNYPTHSDEISGRYYVENKIVTESNNIVIDFEKFIKTFDIWSRIKKLIIIFVAIIITVVGFALFVYALKMIYSISELRKNKKINKGNRIIYMEINNEKVNGDKKILSDKGKLIEGDEIILSDKQSQEMVGEYEMTATVSTISLDQITKNAIKTLKN